MTALEERMYLALLGARTIVSATANVNPQAFKILNLLDAAMAAYKRVQGTESPETEPETADAAGE